MGEEYDKGAIKRDKNERPDGVKWHLVLFFLANIGMLYALFSFFSQSGNQVIPLVLAIAWFGAWVNLAHVTDKNTE